jgi:hypothetical protein
MEAFLLIRLAGVLIDMAARLAPARAAQAQPQAESWQMRCLFRSTRSAVIRSLPAGANTWSRWHQQAR